MNRIRIVGLIFSIACLLGNSPAQPQSNQVEPAKLALEINFYPNEPPAYQPVSSSLHGSSFTRFHRIKASGPNDLPVSAVDIKSIMTADGVRVSVAVLFGDLHEKQKDVATYIIHTGEKVKVDGLSQFGVDPFTIAVVPFTPATFEIPEFISKAKSIDYVGIQPGALRVPGFRVAVRSLSNKNLRAMLVRVLKGGDSKWVLMPQGKEGAPLMPLGNAYEFDVPIATRAEITPNGYTQVTLPGQVIEVSSAIFEDGSFEGDSEPALNYAATLRGHKIQLARVIELLQRALADRSNPNARVETLRTNIAMLNLEADPAVAQEVIAEFGQPVRKTPEELKKIIEVGMNLIKEQALNVVQQFQLRNPTADEGDLQRFLNLNKQRYEAWLSHL